MRRREFIAGLGGAAAWPVVARAQQPTVPVIGVLNSTTFEEFRSYFEAFRRGLAEAGYVEGRNVAFEHRAAEDHYDRLRGLADDLVRLHVAVIFTASNAVSCSRRLMKNGSVPTISAPGLIWARAAKAASISRMSLAYKMVRFWPVARAAS